MSHAGNRSAVLQCCFVEIEGWIDVAGDDLTIALIGD